MKYTIPTVAAAAALTLGAWSTTNALANEEKEENIKLSDAPETVQKALKEKAGGAEIVEVEKEVEHGKTVYEAVIVKDGKRVGIEVDEHGKSLGTHDEEKEHKEGEGKGKDKDGDKD